MYLKNDSEETHAPKLQIYQQQFKAFYLKYYYYNLQLIYLSSMYMKLNQCKDRQS